MASTQHTHQRTKIILCTGPTACGKTALVHALVKPHDIIINADSRQLYKHLDIATAKPTTTEQAAHSYKLIDHQDLTQPFTAYDFLETVRQTAETKPLHDNQRIFIVGGTLFYLSLLETGLPTVKVPPTLTAALEQEYLQYGLPKLLAELSQKDSNYYKKIDKQNPRRVLRALAIIRHTQKPIVALSATKTPSPYDLLKIILVPPKKTLWEAIEKRAESMFEADRIIHEVTSLLEKGISKATLLRHKTIGYLEVVEYLNGFYTQEVALAKVIKRTKLLAKRQINWIQKQHHANFIFLGTPEDFRKSSATSSRSKKASFHSLVEGWAFTPDTIKNQANQLFFATQTKEIYEIASQLCTDFYSKIKY